MANHTLTFSMNDPYYRLLLIKQKEEGKDIIDGKPVSPDIYAKEKLCEFLDPQGKYSH